MNIINYTLSAILISLSVYVLYIGKNVLIPLVIAIALWYLIVILTEEFKKIYVHTWKMPHALALALSLITFSGVIYAFYVLLNGNINEIISAAPVYQRKLITLIGKIYLFFEIDDLSLIYDLFKNLNFASIITSFLAGITTFAGYVAWIFVYIVFILIEQTVFDKKLKELTKTNEKLEKINKFIKKINKEIKTYIKIKTFASILTGLLSYIVMTAVGLDFAAFWALLIFFFNYIPNIGSIIGSLFPVFFSLIQFVGFTEFFILTPIIISIQFLIGNILEPKLQGHSLNVSPLVILISLAVWGQIWGVVGMFLCVPIMVITNMILAKFPSTKPIAIMLSSDGKIDTEDIS